MPTPLFAIANVPYPTSILTDSTPPCVLDIDGFLDGIVLLSLAVAAFSLSYFALSAAAAMLRLIISFAGFFFSGGGSSAESLLAA